MITKNNIAKVLKHNRIDDFSLAITWIELHTFKKGATSTVIDLNNPNLIPIIESHYGRKLEPLPEPNPLVGKWVKCLYNSEELKKNKWYQSRGLSNDIIYVSDGISIVGIHKGCFNLDNICKYNPDEEIILKVGDKIDLIDYTTDTNKGHVITKIDYFTREIYLYNRPKECCVYLRFDSAHKIESVNGRQGKFVIPPFNFEQTLLDAGFKQENDIEEFTKYRFSAICIRAFGSGNIWFLSNKIKPTPANAKILIDAANILNKLDLAK